MADTDRPVGEHQPVTEREPCLYADIADGGCALRATADSPPPMAVQARESIYRIRELEALVRDLTDADDCWYDHHGYCQAHSLHEKPCPHERAKQTVRGCV